MCNQLWFEGYEPFRILSLTSGRVVEAVVEAEEEVRGRTYRRDEDLESDDPFGFPKTEVKHYVDTGVGYSVTDGVVIIAKLRK